MREAISTTIASCIGSWKGYTLSGDGKRLMIQTEKCELHFDKIVCMSLRPASHVEQLDIDKEFRQAVCYKLLENRVVPHPILAESYGITVEIGPAYLPLRLSGEAKQLRELKGFHIEGDYFAVTLICRDFTISEGIAT